MSRKIFLTLIACIALAVGTFALVGPSALLDGKGATATLATNVMTREVGVLLLSVGLLTFLVRSHRDSPTLKAILIANGSLQMAIFPIEIAAHVQGTFAKLSGIAPNSVFHVIAASGFIYFATRIKHAPPAA
ncbi:hypothetical protein BH09MYX1_BH09MYX1_13630 [soil metagenome]